MNEKFIRKIEKQSKLWRKVKNNFLKRFGKIVDVFFLLCCVFIVVIPRVNRAELAMIWYVYIRCVVLGFGRNFTWKIFIPTRDFVLLFERAREIFLIDLIAGQRSIAVVVSRIKIEFPIILLFICLTELEIGFWMGERGGCCGLKLGNLSWREKLLHFFDVVVCSLEFKFRKYNSTRGTLCSDCVLFLIDYFRALSHSFRGRGKIIWTDWFGASCATLFRVWRLRMGSNLSMKFTRSSHMEVPTQQHNTSEVSSSSSSSSFRAACCCAQCRCDVVESDGLSLIHNNLPELRKIKCAKNKIYWRPQLKQQQTEKRWGEEKYVNFFTSHVAGRSSWRDISLSRAKSHCWNNIYERNCELWQLKIN